VVVVCLYPSALPKDKLKSKPKPGEKKRIRTVQRWNDHRRRRRRRGGRKNRPGSIGPFGRSVGQSVEKMRGDSVSNQIKSHSNNHARQTTPLPPSPPLLLHLHLRLHQLRLHPGAFLLVLADGGAVEEVCQVGDCGG
jgi:hypothetical protein